MKLMILHNKYLFLENSNVSEIFFTTIHPTILKIETSSPTKINSIF